MSHPCFLLCASLHSKYISCFFLLQSCQVISRGLCVSVVRKSFSEGVFCTVTVNVCSLYLKFLLFMIQLENVGLVSYNLQLQGDFILVSVQYI